VVIELCTHPISLPGFFLQTTFVNLSSFAMSSHNFPAGDSGSPLSPESAPMLTCTGSVFCISELRGSQVFFIDFLKKVFWGGKDGREGQGALFPGFQAPI
jgi:hypothetical protein